jgi:hypothetical protein
VSFKVLDRKGTTLAATAREYRVGLPFEPQDGVDHVSPLQYLLHANLVSVGHARHVGMAEVEPLFRFLRDTFAMPEMQFPRVTKALIDETEPASPVESSAPVAKSEHSCGHMLRIREVYPRTTHWMESSFGYVSDDTSDSTPVHFVRDEHGALSAYVRNGVALECRDNALYALHDEREARNGHVLRVLAFDAQGVPQFMVVASVKDAQHTWSTTDPKSLEVSDSVLHLVRKRWTTAYPSQDLGQRRVEIELQ